MGKDVSVENFLWVDLEMTGLNVEKEVIIEVGAIITDLEFNPLDQYHAVVRQPDEYLDRMDEWNKEHHGKSGLIDKIPHGQSPDDVEGELIALTQKHFRGPAILAGNSIGQDRLFIDKYFKKFSALLHYRMLDVSSWKIIMKEKFNTEYKKSGQHRALDDIQESIDELKHYLQFINIP